MTQVQLARVAILPVTVTGNLGSRLIPAKLDTGAEMCCLFNMIVFGLTADRPVAEIDFTGLTGQPERLQIYELDVEIEGQLFQGIRVAAGQSDRAILGMNLLNKLLVTLDGPGSHFRI